VIGLVAVMALQVTAGQIEVEDIPKSRYSKVSKGISTIFGYKGDKYGSGKTRCLRNKTGRLRPVDPENDIGIAHRYLDCGAVVYLTNRETGKTIRTVVLDAGPYGASTIDPATGEKVWYIKRKPGQLPSKEDCPSQLCKEGRYRGIADLTPEAARLLGHDGWAHVKLVYDRRDLRWYRRLQKAKQRQRDRRRNQI
jgi:hypothetical protein